MRLSTNDVLKYALIKTIEKKRTNKLFNNDFEDYVYVIKSLLAEKGISLDSSNTNNIKEIVNKIYDGNSTYFEFRNIKDVNIVKERLYKRLSHIEYIFKDPKALFMLGIKHNINLNRRFYVKKLPLNMNFEKGSIKINGIESTLKTYCLNGKNIKIIEMIFPSIESSKSFIKPDWFKFEVTNIKEFDELNLIAEVDTLHRYFDDKSNFDMSEFKEKKKEKKNKIKQIQFK